MCFLRVLNDAMAKKWQKRHEKWAKDNDITVPYLQIIYLNHEESRLHNIFPYVTLKVELARGSFGKRFPRAKAVISSRREEEACLTCLSIMYLKKWMYMITWNSVTHAALRPWTCSTSAMADSKLQIQAKVLGGWALSMVGKLHSAA